MLEHTILPFCPGPQTRASQFGASHEFPARLGPSRHWGDRANKAGTGMLALVATVAMVKAVMIEKRIVLDVNLSKFVVKAELR